MFKHRPNRHLGEGFLQRTENQKLYDSSRTYHWWSGPRWVHHGQSAVIISKKRALYPRCETAQHCAHASTHARTPARTSQNTTTPMEPVEYLSERESDYPNITAAYVNLLTMKSVNLRMHWSSGLVLSSKVGRSCSSPVGKSKPKALLLNI